MGIFQLAVFAYSHTQSLRGSLEIRLWWGLLVDLYYSTDVSQKYYFVCSVAHQSCDFTAHMSTGMILSNYKLFVDPLFKLISSTVPFWTRRRQLNSLPDSIVGRRMYLLMRYPTRLVKASRCFDC